MSDSRKKILVLGANGNVGRALVEQLVAQGESVRAASRNGQAPAGAEGVVFDHTDPSTHAAALDGVDRAFLMLPTGHVNVAEVLLPLVRALADRRIKVVFQSVLGVDADDQIPYRQVELALIASGTPHVILRPNWFADNFHTFWLSGVQQGVIAVPAGEGRSSFIDTRDIAASAAAALTNPAFEGQAFNLTGPQALGYADAAALISEALGRPVRYAAVSDDDFVQGLVGAGVPAVYAGFLASIFYPVREGWTAGVSDAVQTLTGRAPRSLAQYVADHVADLGQAAA